MLQYFHIMHLWDDLELVNELQKGLNDVEQALQGFQLLKIRINEADYSTPLAYTVKLMDEWFGEEYTSTCMLEYIFDKCVPRFSFYHRSLVEFESTIFGSEYAKLFDFLGTFPNITCTLPRFTPKEVPIHD